MTFTRSNKIIASVLAAGFAVVPAASCGSSDATPPGGATPAAVNPIGGDDGGGGGGRDGATVDSGQTVTDPSQPVGAQPVDPEPTPTSPPDDNGGQPTWPSAPVMPGIQVAANRDSAVVYVPDVAGVKDYRVMLLPAGIGVSADGSGAETVTGTTMFCAGNRQHSAKAGVREVLRMIEVYGLTGATRVVIEALDAACPFPGVRGRDHHDFAAPAQEVVQADRVPFAVYTEQEIIQKYGSLIINGHGPGATLSGQAAPVAPHVLARTTIKVVPLGNTGPGPTSTFFDDFDTSEAMVSVPITSGRAQFPVHFTTSKWHFYSFGAGNSQIYFDRKQLRMVLNDLGEDIMSTNMAMPRRAAAIAALPASNDYLHVSYEVQNDATPRRYWWLSLCGPETGTAFDAQGNFLGNVVQTPSFMENDGLNPSVEGWNCLQVFTRDGWPYGMPPDGTAPQTEVRVMLNEPGDLARDNVVNIDPVFMPANQGPPSWYRQIDKAGNPVAKLLDDQQLVAPRTRFDFFIRRDRVVMYANGTQRLCNDFTGHPLSMAEAAVGYGQVFYHSTAERLELHADYWDRTGKLYINENSPYQDVRTYDNVGYTEHAAAPANFDESVCFKSTQ